MYSVVRCELSILTKKAGCGWSGEVGPCCLLAGSCSQGAFEEEGMTDRYGPRSRSTVRGRTCLGTAGDGVHGDPGAAFPAQ